MLELKHHLSRSFRGLCLHPHGAHEAAACGALFAHRHQPPHTALVACSSRFDPLTKPRFFLREPLVEFVVVNGLVREPFIFLAKEHRVVSRPRRQAAAVELDDARRDALEKHTIVRHEYDGAGVVDQKALEPHHRFDVEMIGRLVQQQQIGLGDQRAGQQDPALPAAGQCVHNHVGRKIEPLQHGLDALFHAPAVALLELVLQTTERGQ